MKIQEFSFGNFRSFKDINTLKMSAAKIKSKNPQMDCDHVIQGTNPEGISFLKSKAIYGANASGKSNVIKALVSFLKIISTSVKDDEVLKYIEPFRLSEETEVQPSFFQIVFWQNDVKYRYGFEATQEAVTAEWLYGKPGSREMCYFIRDKQEIIELDKTNFTEGVKLKTLLLDDSGNDNEVFRTNSLFLSTLASFGFAKLSKEIVSNLSTVLVISGLGHSGMYRIAGDALDNDNMKKYIFQFLQKGDVGIKDLYTIEVPGNEQTGDDENDKNQKVIISSKQKFKKEQATGKANFIFNLNESEGTKKLFEVSPFIFRAIKEKLPIVIDEFDARFHPLLTKKIVQLFNSQSNKGAQLIFTTHDTNLLSNTLLRRDQVDFTEKDKFGASHLYSLVEFKGVRNTASYEKDYIQGKYGAIPFLGDFEKVFQSEPENTSV